MDVLKLKVASRAPRKIRDAFRGPGSRGSSRGAGGGSGNECPLQADLQFLEASGRAHANHGMDVKKWDLG